MADLAAAAKNNVEALEGMQRLLDAAPEGETTLLQNLHLLALRRPDNSRASAVLSATEHATLNQRKIDLMDLPPTSQEAIVVAGSEYDRTQVILALPVGGSVSERDSTGGAAG